MDLSTLYEFPLWFAVFLLSLTCHEAAHALVAQWGGDHTAAAGGQVSLDPIPHIRREPFGTLVVPILSYFLYGWMLGWAEDMGRLSRYTYYLSAFVAGVSEWVNGFAEYAGSHQVG